MLPDIDHWSREPITTLPALSMFMSRFIRTNYHAGQIFIPHRINYIANVSVETGLLGKYTFYGPTF